MLMLQCTCVLAECVVTSTAQAHVLPRFGTAYLQAALSLAEMDLVVCMQKLPIRLPMYPILECGETSSSACLNTVSVSFKVCYRIHIPTCPTHLTQPLDSLNHLLTALITSCPALALPIFVYLVCTWQQQLAGTPVNLYYYYYYCYYY